MIAACVGFSSQVAAQQGVAQEASQPPTLSFLADSAAIPMDRSGTMTGHALLERVQLIVWDKQRIAKPAPEGAIGAASAELLFGIIAGGSGAGQDLAEPKD